MQAVSLFSGCGGMDYGVMAAGFHVGYCNDFDRHSCDTLRQNHYGEVCHASIADIATLQIRKALGVKTGQVELVFGGPPCQPFSKSGYWLRGDTRRLDDPRADTLTQFFRVVEELRPKAFLLENVHGINYSGKEEGFRYILERIAEINRKHGTSYSASWRVLNTAEFGVPQARVRFFLVGLRSGKEFQFPEPTHSVAEQSQPSLFESELHPAITAWDAIGHLTPDSDERLAVGGQWADLLPAIPEGENYLWHTDRKGGLPLFGWRTRYWCFLLKLAKNRPSWTLQAQPGSAIGPFHWLNRKLSWRELAAIQTFPATFRVSGPRVEIQRQIGNAVPSLMAEAIARAISRHLGGKKDSSPLTLAVERAATTPEPEPVQPVPAKYHALIGEHEAHPGTGKGRSYRKATDSLIDSTG
jgi:DNA (cytosine-5)-methyltransferase 1